MRRYGNLKRSLSSLKAALKAVYRSNYTPTLVVYQLAFNLGAPLRLQANTKDDRYRSSISLSQLFVTTHRLMTGTAPGDRRCSDWPRTLSEDYACMNVIGYESYSKNLDGRASIRVTDGLTQGDSISGYASSRLGSHKN